MSDSTTRRKTKKPAPRARPRSVVIAEDELPDVRDGLTRTQRLILVTLKELQEERGGRYVSTFELYGRVTEKLDLSHDEFQRLLGALAGHAQAFSED